MAESSLAHAPAPPPVEDAPFLDPHSWRQTAWPLWQQRLRDGRPILVGPWRSEVGFEVLYWLPFLARLRRSLGLSPEQFIPLSRGGASAWYGTPTGLELYAMRSPQDVRVETKLTVAAHRSQKQYRWTAFDRQLIADATQTLGLIRPHAIHPLWMYHTLNRFWTGHRGLKWLLERAEYGELPVPALPATLALPPHFVAVRFYFRSTFPPTPDVCAFAKATLQQLSKDSPVVILDSGPLSLDDHLDYAPAGMPNVCRLSDLIALTPENNLAMQSAVLARSDGFVGTYGGFAQLALRYKKPVVSLYEKWEGTALAHHSLSQFLALAQGTPFHVLKMGDLPLLQAVLPEVQLRVQPAATKQVAEWQAAKETVSA